MTTGSNKVLMWLKDFKYNWLVQNILNDTRLIDLISNKLNELERLLIQDQQTDTEITIVSDDEYAKTNNPESVVPSTEQRLQNSIEKKSDITEKSSRPAIRLKRIPLVEAAQYLPPGYPIPKSKRGRKRKNIFLTHPHQKKAAPTVKPPPTTQDETATESNSMRRSTRTKKLLQPSSSASVPSIPSTKEVKKRGRRKLRAIDGEDDDLNNLCNLTQMDVSHADNECDQVSRYLGQNGILSQTRKTNDTTIYSDDFPLKLHSRQSYAERSKPLNEGPTIEADRTTEDIPSLEHQQMINNIFDNQDNDSLFTTLEMAQEKSLGTSLVSSSNSILNYDDCIEDITNDGIDPPPPSSSPTIDHLPVST